MSGIEMHCRTNFDIDLDSFFLFISFHQPIGNLIQKTTAPRRSEYFEYTYKYSRCVEGICVTVTIQSLIRDLYSVLHIGCKGMRISFKQKNFPSKKYFYC